MKEPFELQWMGGPSEHHFRKLKPATMELPWGTLDPSQYDPAAVDRARTSWTEVAINEYRAVASFNEVLRALVEVRAPLDLVGMASGFLADECSHVELASRLAMELGGAVPRAIDTERFAARPSRGLTALQRANEIVLKISCISEAFSGGTATVSLATTRHPLVRAVYETILRDESHHRRLGGLYFEWALERIDDAELARLGRVLAGALDGLAPFWRRPRRAPSSPRADEHGEQLGWPSPLRFASVARDVVVRDIVDPLATIGIALSDAERVSLLA